jgi:AraC-like DNA-binding protein
MIAKDKLERRGQFPWSPGRTLRFRADGQHQPQFSKDCPLLMQFYEFSYDYRLTPSYHDYLEISYIYEGKGNYIFENRVNPVHAGDAILAGSKEFHSVEGLPSQTLKAIAIFFLPELVYNPGSPAIEFEYLRPFYYASRKHGNIVPASDLEGTGFYELIEKMHLELAAKRPYYQLAIKAYFSELLLILTRRLPKLANTNTHERRLQDFYRLQEVIDFLNNHFHERISLEDTARMANMSYTYFCKYFRRVTGRSLTDYILRMRVDRAKELLLSEDWSITKVAFEVGFESHSYFDRVFNRLTHLSPHEFRVRHEDPS